MGVINSYVDVGAEVSDGSKYEGYAGRQHQQKVYNAEHLKLYQK